MTERLSYENGVEVGYERGLKATHEDPNILASYSWSQGYNAGLDAAREAIHNLDSSGVIYEADALAAIDALREGVSE